MSTASAWTRTFYLREADGTDFDRVSFFSDAVFAIALTLMAVEIGVPELVGDTSSPQVLWEGLREKWPKIVTYAVAFIWIAVYWRANHRCSMTLRRMNSA